MNPARAWLLLTTRSTGVELTPGGFGSIKPADVALALKGLSRERFLLGMAALAGDRDVLADLHAYVTIDVIVRAERERWETDRGGQVCRSLAGLALFETLNGTRCHVCSGRGTVDPEYLRLRDLPADQRLREQHLARVEDQIATEQLREARRQRSRIERRIRSANRKGTSEEARELRELSARIEALEAETAALRESVPCRTCKGTGRHTLTAAERARIVHCSRSSWYRHWDERYARVHAELEGWVSDCLRHVRRRMAERAA